jgi:hypothetical protein
MSGALGSGGCNVWLEAARMLGLARIMSINSEPGSRPSVEEASISAKALPKLRFKAAVRVLPPFLNKW